MADKKSYRLLSINDASSRQMRMLSREGGDDVYTINVSEGHARLRAELSDLVKAGVVFQNAVFTTHGNKGVIFFGEEWINWETWYTQFYKSGYGKLFAANAKVYFAGCNVADGPQGWKFLEAAARSLLQVNGGFAMGWTSLGFGSPFSGHVRHLWGDTREVYVYPGQSGLRFYEDWKLVTDGTYPIRPQ